MIVSTYSKTFLSHQSSAEILAKFHYELALCKTKAPTLSTITQPIRWNVRQTEHPLGLYKCPVQSHYTSVTKVFSIFAIAINLQDKQSRAHTIHRYIKLDLTDDINVQFSKFAHRLDHVTLEHNKTKLHGNCVNGINQR